MVLTAPNSEKIQTDMTRMGFIFSNAQAVWFEVTKVKPSPNRIPNSEKIHTYQFRYFFSTKNNFKKKLY